MGEIEQQRQKAGFLWKDNNKRNHMHMHDVSCMHDDLRKMIIECGRQSYEKYMRVHLGSQ